VETVACFADYTHVVDVSWGVEGGTAPYEITITISEGSDEIEAFHPPEAVDTRPVYVYAPGGGPLSVSIAVRDSRNWEAASEATRLLTPCPTFGRPVPLPNRFKLLLGRQEGQFPGGAEIAPVTVSGLQAYDDATVFLEGFRLQYAKEDARVNEIGVRLRDISFDEEGRFLTWNAEIVFGDGGRSPLAEPFYWEYDYAVLAYVDDAAKSRSVQATRVNAHSGMYSTYSAPVETSENLFVVPDGFWFDVVRSYWDLKEAQYKPENMDFGTMTCRVRNCWVEDGHVFWTTELEFDDYGSPQPQFSAKTDSKIFESSEVVIVEGEVVVPFFESQGGVDDRYQEVELPEGLAGATVFLRGWQLGFDGGNRPLHGLGMWISDESFDAEANTLSWTASAALYDDDLTNTGIPCPYHWRYVYTIVGFRSLDDSQPVLTMREDEDLPVHLSLDESGTLLTSSIPIRGGTDLDSDGLNDHWEREAMRQLNPYFRLDENEDWIFIRDRHSAANFCRVAPYRTAEYPTFVIFSYVVAWARDYGTATSGFNSHNGDTERVVMAWRILDERTLQLEQVFFSAHEGTGYWDYSQAVGADDLVFYDSRVVVYVSHGKHANYRSRTKCESVRKFDEDCGGGGLFRLPCYYVGDLGASREIDDLTGFGFPGETLNGMTDEDGTWHQNFCGGLGWDGDCAKAISYWLLADWIPGELADKL